MLYTTVFNTDNNHERFSEHHIRVISEGWSHDDNFSFDHEDKLHFAIYSHRNLLFDIRIIFHNIAIFTVFLIK